MTGKKIPIASIHSMSSLLTAYLKSTVFIGILAYLFYRSWLFFVLLLPLSVWQGTRLRRKEREKQARALAGQFRDGLLALSASLRAGHSAENAFRDAAEELAFLYGKEGRMAGEFRRVVGRTEMNVPLEQATAEMAARLRLPDAENFTAVFSAAKRTGGELVQIILETVQTITGKLEVQEEIYTMLRGRQYEQQVMKLVPLLILFYLDFSSPGFFEVLYETLPGRVIMTGCLAIYLGASVLAERISDIGI